MQKKYTYIVIFFPTIIFLLIVVVLIFSQKKQPLPYYPLTPTTTTSTLPIYNPTSTPTSNTKPTTHTASYVDLEVPFTSEIPEGKWVAPWNNACEEASIIMVEQYYLGKKSLTKQEAKNLMLPLFDLEDKMFGSNVNTDATQTAELINKHTSFEATVKRNPTLEELKQELRDGHPIIVPLYGFDLQNPRIPFRRGSTYYHMFVIVGFNDQTKEFIVNDNGLEDGLDYTYSYAIIADALADFNQKTYKTDGPPTAIFTRPKP